MTRASARKRCTVAYATFERQYQWQVELDADATIAVALLEARRMCASQEIPWDSAPVGIFGALKCRTDIPADGDRIELYRPLQNDPRERRREHVRKVRRGRSRL